MDCRPSAALTSSNSFHLVSLFISPPFAFPVMSECVHNLARLLVCFCLTAAGGITLRERPTLRGYVHGFPVQRFSGRTQWGGVEPSDAEQITASSL